MKTFTVSTSPANASDSFVFTTLRGSRSPVPFLLLSPFRKDPMNWRDEGDSKRGFHFSRLHQRSLLRCNSLRADSMRLLVSAIMRCVGSVIAKRNSELALKFRGDLYYHLEVSLEGVEVSVWSRR